MPITPKMFRPAHQVKVSADDGVREIRRIEPQGRTFDDRRGTAASRGYGSRWQSARRGYMKAHPLCVCCEANGRITPTDMVDHAIPHQGDMAIFWKSEDWQALCNDCNQRIKQPIELRWKRGDVDDEDLFLARPMPEFFPQA